MVPALVILALWAVLLGPGAVRWLRVHRRTTSIASFHRELHGLARSGPKLVAPAHRLSDEVGVPEPWEPRRAAEGPHLVLLRTGANDKEHDMRYDGRDEEFLATSRASRRRAARPAYDPFDPADDDPFADDWDAEASLARLDPPTRATRTVRAPVADDRPTAQRRARHAAPATVDAAKVRRTRILVGLGVAVAGSFLLGLIPGLTILWAITVVSVIALAGYLALMYYASNAGLYRGANDERRPVARAVVAAPVVSAYEADEVFDAEDYAPRRAAAGR